MIRKTYGDRRQIINGRSARTALCANPTRIKDNKILERVIKQVQITAHFTEGMDKFVDSDEVQ
jgi:hypothetical protein